MKFLNCLLTVFASSVALHSGLALTDNFHECHSNHYLLANETVGDVIKDIFSPRSRTVGAARFAAPQQDENADWSASPCSRTAAVSVPPSTGSPPRSRTASGARVVPPPQIYIYSSYLSSGKSSFTR